MLSTNVSRFRYSPVVLFVAVVVGRGRGSKCKSVRVRSTSIMYYVYIRVCTVVFVIKQWADDRPYCVWVEVKEEWHWRR